MASATPSVASQKSGSQSLVSLSQECGLKLMASLEFGRLASRGYVRSLGSDRLVMDRLPYPAMRKASVLG